MATLKDAKSIGTEFKKGSELVKVTYDFSKDTGAIASYKMITATHACIVKLVHAKVITAATSSDAMTVTLGKGSAGTEFWADMAVASLAINTLHPTLLIGGQAGVYLAAADTIEMGIVAFAALSGKIEFTFEIFAV